MSPTTPTTFGDETTTSENDDTDTTATPAPSDPGAPTAEPVAPVTPVTPVHPGHAQRAVGRRTGAGRARSGEPAPPASEGGGAVAPSPD